MRYSKEAWRAKRSPKLSRLMKTIKRGKNEKTSQDENRIRLDFKSKLLGRVKLGRNEKC